MKESIYCPDRGDIIWLDFTPQRGHEQRGRRPALVLSPKSYNNKVGLALICPVTTNVKNYPFEVKLTKNYPVTGVIISDQVKSLDWVARNSEFISRVSDEIVEETINKFSTLIKLQPD